MAFDRKRNTIVLIIVVLLLCQIQAVQAAGTAWITIAGENHVIDTFNGVDALYTANDNTADDTIYSCAAYAKKYYKEIYHLNLSNLIDDGPPLLSNAGVVMKQTKEPKAGDIVFWPTSLNPNNHTAIIREVNGTTLTLIEQNYKSKGIAAYRRTVTYPNASFTIWTPVGTFDTYMPSEKKEPGNTAKPTPKPAPQPSPKPKEDEVQIAFRDLEKNYWAYDAIVYCVKNGIFSGYEDGTFQPEKIINRGEFASAICRFLGFEGIGKGSAFQDIKGDEWYAPYVEIADIYMGTGQNASSFYPLAGTKREDVCVAAVKIKGLDIAPYMGKALPFIDEDTISKDKKAYVAAAVDHGIMKGFDNASFGAQMPISRAQAAAVFDKLK